MAQELEIRPEVPGDRQAIGRVHTEAFADDGQVARLVGALRSAPAPLPVLSFVAEADGQIAGHVMLTASRLDAPQRLVDVYVLSPLGVLPAFQRRGIGTALVGHAVEAANASGVPLLFLEGSPRYYGTRGFERADEAGFRSPSLRIPPPAFQVARLCAYEPWMTGALVYSETFWAHDCVGLRPGAATPEDLRYLALAIGVAASARRYGNHPFGAVLVAGERVLEAENTVVTGRDRTGHAEMNLVRLAEPELDPGALTAATLYTSTEPCAMCAGAIYWAGIGRVVFALAETELLRITGVSPANPTLDLPCREVFARGQRHMTVLGPLLTDDARAVHEGFW